MAYKACELLFIGCLNFFLLLFSTLSHNSNIAILASRHKLYILPKQPYRLLNPPEVVLSLLCAHSES